MRNAGDYVVRILQIRSVSEKYCNATSKALYISYAIVFSSAVDASTMFNFIGN